MTVNLKSLVGRLNDICRNALEAAAGLCLSRTNYDVEVEHLLLKLLEATDTDLDYSLHHFEVDRARLMADVQRALDRLKTGNARTPALSPRLPRLFEDAWLLASIDYGAARIRSGHLLLALLSSDDVARLAREISKEFNRISLETLRGNFSELTSNSSENRMDPSLNSQGVNGDGGQSGLPSGGKTPALDQYTIDLTARARDGHLDQVLGRDFEIRQIVDILTRRRQNNPILTGEAGVGKTAVAEGFALRVAEGDVPEPLRNVSLRTLDLGLLQAGAGIKGEFENRLKNVIAEVKASPQPIILFIDEAHTMIGAGGQAGQSDAANLLKPALARGELRTIAATTWAEYKKYFEKDAALARRFQVVKINEPDEATAITMMRGLTAALEEHHQVRILDEAVEDAVRLSHRYISGRQLPDKSVSVLDTAAARVRISNAATPPAIEDARRRLDQLGTEITSLEREAATGADHGERLAELSRVKAETESSLVELEMRWTKERDLIERLRQTRSRLEESISENGDGQRGDAHTWEQGNTDGEEQGEAHKADEAHRSDEEAPRAAQVDEAPPPSTEERAALQTQLDELTRELSTLQGEAPLMHPHVNSQTIAEVISGWTGIPVGKMMVDEINSVLALSDRLAQRVIGQGHALEAIAQRIRTAHARLVDPRRPVGVFLLVGPSGVGKTETALALAEALYGGERNLVSINMSEYQEAHTVSSLKGSPPGYVGYGEGGVLTEAVRRKPYSVVLLDEVEKAHPDVMELFFQVFDKGQLEDAEGREIDFKNTVILLTSNVATETIMKLCADPETRPEAEALTEAMRPELLKVFKPALLGRMTVVPYYPITDDAMRKIILLQLGRIGQRLFENHKVRFAYDDAVVSEIAARCREVESGARNVDHILTRTLLPELSGEFLSRMAQAERVSRVMVGVGAAGEFVYEIV
ncbi:MAG TPA: type VI secretion system ATPase TssH [Pyrinomonadaceae bacterium]|jgi:type VI secretion system protein VasG|nr:type VI secretion system ATPase TssH [Pyrinomonadaceae bacterium]